MDESGPGDETPPVLNSQQQPTVVQKRVISPISGTPPLLPKSRSLDIHHDDDHEMVLFIFLKTEMQNDQLCLLFTLNY